MREAPYHLPKFVRLRLLDRRNALLAAIADVTADLDALAQLEADNSDEEAFIKSLYDLTEKHRHCAMCVDGVVSCRDCTDGIQELRSGETVVCSTCYGHEVVPCRS